MPVSGSTVANPDWEKVAEAVRPSVVAIKVQISGGEAEGSGVIVDTKGHILTNNHVVAGATQGGISVTLSDGRVFAATVAGTDPTTDLAVITLTNPPSDLVPAVLGDSSKVVVGEPVMAVGNPLGLSSTVTTGIVSALDRPVTTSDGSSQAVVTNAIQIDAAINPGNSGGPLFNAQGEVVGITSSIASLSQSSGSIGLGFAIPSNLANRIGAELLADGTASHALLGVELTDGQATADGVTRMGAKILSVSPAPRPRRPGSRPATSSWRSTATRSAAPSRSPATSGPWPPARARPSPSSATGSPSRSTSRSRRSTRPARPARSRVSPPPCRACPGVRGADTARRTP